MGCQSAQVSSSDNFFSRQALWIKEFAMFHFGVTANPIQSTHLTPMRSLGAALKGTWSKQRMSNSNILTPLPIAKDQGSLLFLTISHLVL